MTDKKKIIRIDENRILTYSTLATSFLVANNLFATVDKTTDGLPAVVDGQFDVDFDGDATAEYRIYHGTGGTSYALMKVVGGVGAIGQVDGQNGLAFAFTSNNLIDSSLDANDGVNDANWGGVGVQQALASGNFLKFPGKGDKYIGVKFTKSTNTHYGWILVNVASSSTQVTVKEYAYEETPDLGIYAGSDQSLPVVLSVFSGNQEGDTVILNWSTDSETENLGFILERRESGPSGASGTEWKQIAHFNTDPELAGQGSKVTRTDYSYTDAGVQVGKRYSYRLTDVSYQVMYKGISRVIHDVEVNPIHASSFKLHPSYPNPFNPITTLGFTIDQAEDVKLSVYNLRGQLIHNLVNESRPAGFHEVDWNASDIEAGVYFVELIAGEKRQMQKITLLK